MSNFEYAYNRNGKVPFIEYALNAKSATVKAGDPLVRSYHADISTASNPVVRRLTAADITADYLQTAKAGIYGFAAHDFITNSSGVPSTPTSYANKAASADPIYALPSYGSGLAVDPTISYGQAKVYVATPDMVFRGKLGGGGTTTMSNVLVGTLAGIDIAAVTTFTIDTSEPDKVIIIVGWDQIDTAYCYFSVVGEYCQALNGVNYSTSGA